MLHSYSFVNALFYQKNLNIPLSHNLFGTLECPRIKRNWIQADSDLPLVGRKLDVDNIQVLVQGYKASTYMFCCSIQKCLNAFLLVLQVDVSMIHLLLVIQMKALMTMHTSLVLDLSYWERKLQILPMEFSEKKIIFSQMLQKYKVTKFWDVNYKILMHILATTVVLA